MSEYASERKNGSSRGPWPHDHEADDETLSLLGVGPGCVFLDAGCGAGEIALSAAAQTGPLGRVVAFDLDGARLFALRKDASAAKLPLLVLRADLTQGVPLADGAADACLAAGVLHMPMVWRELSHIFSEFGRILKPGGKLGVSLRLMRDAPVGPPAPDARARKRIVDEAAKSGLILDAERDFGFQRFLSFRKSASSNP